MTRGEHDFEKQEFSVVKQCPRCQQLSLSFKGDMLICSNCGYGEKIPTVR